MPAPTFPDSQSLAEGTGTRALTAVTTAASDWVVVEIIAEINNSGESFVPTATGLTFTNQNDAGTVAGGTDVRVLQYTAPDATGASRTITVTPSGGSAATRNYRALVTVVRGSTGPGAKGTTLTAQTVTFTRTGSNSAVHMAFGDFSTAGTAAGASFQPGAAAAVSVTDGTGADYYFGRWNDSGAAGSSAHGVNVGTNTLTTPAGAALEMLGTGGTPDEGPQTVPMFLPSLSYDPLMQGVIFPMRPWQRRFQWIGQPWLNSDAAVTAGPPASTEIPPVISQYTGFF